MAEKKKQHYVPKVYLRCFADGNKRFSVYNIEKRTAIPSAFCDNQCYRDYFYGKDCEWENQLGEMETKWGVLFRLIHEHKQLGEDDIKLLKTFALYQRQRTFAENEYRKKENEELLIECGKMVCENKGIPFTEEARDICIKKADEHISPAQLLQLSSDIILTIDDLSVLIIDYETKNKLISSDVPVIAINQFDKRAIGYAMMGLILLFPISSSQLVVIYDRKMYPQFRNRLYIVSKNEKEILRLNALQLISGEKILFSYSMDEFQSFTEEDWEWRGKNREGNKLSSLGSSDRKLMCISTRKTLNNYEFSFASMTSTFQKIPTSCREAVPRKWEQGWEEKLKVKITLLPEIMFEKKGYSHVGGLNKSQYKKGFERMLNAAKQYWKIP